MISLTLAAAERVIANGELGEESAKTTEWRWRLISVLYHLYALQLPFTASEMCRLIDSGHGSAPPISRLVEYFRSHDLSPEACAALRRQRDAYTARIGRDYRHVDVQNDLQLLDMLLWHDEWDEIDPAACWSERVRCDYRAMSGDRRRRWMALLRHIRGDAGSKPAKPWIKEAHIRLAAVGVAGFRTTIGGWFACFRRPEPLRLSVVGSHVLKGLLWYCTMARDPALTGAALPIVDAAWKPKRNLDKVMVALALLIDTMPVEEAWAALLPLQSAWGVSQGQIERLAIKIAAAHGIPEEQLRALDVLKPAPVAQPSVSEKRPSGKVALAGPSTGNGYEYFVAMLRVLQAR
jgi:hypothetical protein